MPKRPVGRPPNNPRKEKKLPMNDIHLNDEIEITIVHRKQTGETKTLDDVLDLDLAFTKGHANKSLIFMKKFFDLLTSELGLIEETNRQKED